MKAGELRHRVTIQRKQPPVNDPKWGVIPGEWADIATVFTFVEPLAADEYLRDQRIASEADCIVRMRARSDIAVRPTDRLVYHQRGGDQKLDVIGIIDIDNRHRELRITCKLNWD